MQRLRQTPPQSERQLIPQATSLRTLRELARSYLVITQGVTRVMNRTKALYRGWGIPCGGQQVYAANHREAWLSKLPETGVRRREHFYQELDALRALRQQARHDLLVEARKQPATRWLRQVPYIGPIWSALLVALLQTPHRFRTKRQLSAETEYGTRWVFQDVHEGGPAHTAGIEPGNILLRVNGKDIVPPEHPVFPMGSASSLELVANDGSTRTVSVVVAQPVVCGIICRFFEAICVVGLSRAGGQ